MSELASPFAAIYDTKAKNKVTDQPVGTGPIKLISINVRKNRTKTIQRLLARYAKIKN